MFGYFFSLISVITASFGFPIFHQESFTNLSTGQADGDEIPLGGLNFTENEAFLLVGYPAGLLRIVGFGLIDTLLFERNEQVWGWIGILPFSFYDLGHD